MAEDTTQAAEPTTTPEPHGEGTDWKAEARKWQQRSRDNRAEAASLRADLDEARALADARADYDDVVAERDRLVGEIARRDLVDRVSRDTGVPAELLHGDTEDELAASAEAVRAYADARQPAWPTDKGGAASHVAKDSADRFMEALGL